LVNAFETNLRIDFREAMRRLFQERKIG